MWDFVTALPDAREGVRRLSQVLSGIVVNTRISEVRKGAPQSFTSSGSFSSAAGLRMLSSEDAQLAQESVDRLAALISLGPSRNAHLDSDSSFGAVIGGGGGSGGPDGGGATGFESLSEDQVEQYLTEMYDMLLRCRVPEALGELTAMAGSALLGGPNTRGGGGGAPPAASASSGGLYDEAALHDEAVRRRSLDLRLSLDMYVRDGGPSPARASIEGLLCSQKLSGHAHALLESISTLLLSCVFDPIWRHRDLLAQPKVRDLVVALSRGALLPALAHMCTKLRQLLNRPAGLEAASHAWLLGFVARNFTGMCRCMKAMVEFESCAALWAQLGDAFAAQLTTTRLVEKFSAAAAAVHPSYMTWRVAPPPGTAVDTPLPAGPGGPTGGGLGATAAAQRLGETYLELCTAVEVFLEGLFHLTWHFTARAEEAAAAGPPPPLLVRDVLAAMEPEGSGSVADLLAAAASAATATDVRSGALGPLASLVSIGSCSGLLPAGAAASAASPSAAAAVAVAAVGAWPGLVSGPATHCLAADWLAHVVARLDGGELLTSSAGLAPQVAAAAPLLYRPGPVDRDELPLLLSVCLAVAAAGAPEHIAANAAGANGGTSTSAHRLCNTYHHSHSQAAGQTPAPAPPSAEQQRAAGRTGRNSIEIIFGSVASVGAGAGGGGEGQRHRETEAEALAGSVAAAHAMRMLRLMARGLKTMAATQDAELAPYPAIHAAHSCAVAMHKILQDSFSLAARSQQSGAAAAQPWNASASASAAGPLLGGSSGPLFWPFAPPPAPHTALLLDCFQAALLCYSSFLQPDPDKDPLTLRAVERCNEQLLELCTATGADLRKGVATVVYAAHAGLLLALEAVVRAAALTCRLESLRVLLGAVLGSVPALQQLLLSRDGYLFLTLRKLVIACVNLACPHPLESSMPAVQPATSRRSLTLILQQCISGLGSPASASVASSSQQLGGSVGRGGFASDWAAANGGATMAAAEGRPSVDGGRSNGRRSVNLTAGAHPSNGRPLILPLAVDLLDTVSMLARRFVEVHEGRVAAAANIRVDNRGNVVPDPSETVNFDDEDGVGEDGGYERGRRDSTAAATAAAAATEHRRRSFEREANELLPLAQLLPFALWWLGGPISDLVDALAQEVINDDGSGSLYGDVHGGGGGGGASAAVLRTQHARAGGRSRSASNGQQPSGSRRTSAEQHQSYGTKSEMRRQPSVDIARSGLPARSSGRGGAAAAADAVQPPPRTSPWSSTLAAAGGGGGGGGVTGSGDRSWFVLSRCADTLYALFRLMVAVSDLNRRAPHPDWPALIASLQPQQLLARAVQLLVHGVQSQRQQAAGESTRPSRPRGPAFPVLLSSLLSACVCGVQCGWLVPESFGIPSATVDPSELEQSLPYPMMLTQQPPPPPPATSAAGAAGGGPVQGPLFSRVRRFTVISANPEGRAYQWAMIGDEEAADDVHAAEGLAAAEAAEGASDSETVGTGEDEEGEGEGEGEVGKAQARRRQRVVLLQAAAPGGAWASLPPPPGPAVVPTRALQMLVLEYGTAADKLLFDLLLRGLSTKARSGGGAAAAAAADAAGDGAPPLSMDSQHQHQHQHQHQPAEPQQFFWVPPSRSRWLRTCSNPCCMNLSGLHEAQLRLAACPRCGQEWYCSRHCQAMHWHIGHKTKCKGGK